MSASSVAPRYAPSKKMSVCGVMRNGASLSPKCSRYTRRLFGLRFQFAVERGAVHAEQLRGLADVAVRELQRGLDVGALPALQRVVEIERRAALELPERLLGERARIGRRPRGERLEVELRFQLRHRDAPRAVLRHEPDH